jgi:hypothetical protein
LFLRVQVPRALNTAGDYFTFYWSNNKVKIYYHFQESRKSNAILQIYVRLWSGIGISEHTDQTLHKTLHVGIFNLHSNELIF